MRWFSTSPDDPVCRYRFHILFFLVTLIVTLTIAHPSIFVTDEWITINQLSQLDQGHQVIISEGKYGWTENGSQSGDPSQNSFYLVYPLFLPLLSLPALWLVNLMDRFLILAVVYLWTFLLISLALFVYTYFPDHCRIGKYRWTSAVIVLAFLLFFSNLVLIRPFAADGDASFPEILAVVITYTLLLSIMAVVIYEINRLVFPEPGYAVSATLVCLSCSSYFFWANFCKDHLLVAFLFVLLTLMIVRFVKSATLWDLAGAFFLAGLMAWARPELALFVFLFLGLFVLYVRFFHGMPSGGFQARWQPPLLLTPLFTLAGAIPFLLNNYLFTGNLFVPAWALWKMPVPSPDTIAPGTVPVQISAAQTGGSLLHLFVSSTNFHPATMIPDVYGVLFTPQNGNLGVFPVVPLFLIALFCLPVLQVFSRLQFSAEEKYLLTAMSVLALGVFCAYLRGISGLNTSVGIVPDMRYLSPIYIPLSIIGLIIIRKIPGVIESSSLVTRSMLFAWGILVPLSTILIVAFYPFPEIFAELFLILNVFMVLLVFILTAVSLMMIVTVIQNRVPVRFAVIPLAVTCALPLVWQIDASILVRLYGTGLGGYSFLLPVVRTIILIHFA